MSPTAGTLSIELASRLRAGECLCIYCGALGEMSSRFERLECVNVEGDRWHYPSPYARMPSCTLLYVSMFPLENAFTIATSPMIRKHASKRWRNQTILLRPWPVRVKMFT